MLSTRQQATRLMTYAEERRISRLLYRLILRLKSRSREITKSRKQLGCVLGEIGEYGSRPCTPD
jgi:hypothetical protein